VIGNLEPEENVMTEGAWLGDLGVALQKLGWQHGDDIAVEIGGMSVTGTATHPDANPKWAKPFGTITYQKDAFIVIKNRTRTPFEPSKYNSELKAHHAEP
jgi:hypothetical protein